MPKKKKSPVRALTEAEQRKLQAYLTTDCYGAFFAFLLNSGLRVGELIALRWNKVDLTCGSFAVTATAGRGRESEPKTEESKRTLPITADLRALFFEASKSGVYGTVFKNRNGQALAYRATLDRWHKLTDTAGIPRCGLHTLRHTYATNALRAGVNYKVLSKLLGHASVAVTMDIYCDVNEVDKLSAAEKISEYRKKRIFFTCNTLLNPCPRLRGKLPFAYLL